MKNVNLSTSHSRTTKRPADASQYTPWSLFSLKGLITRTVMRGFRKFCQRGFNFEGLFFLVYEEREDPNTTLS